MFATLSFNIIQSHLTEEICVRLFLLSKDCFFPPRFGLEREMGAEVIHVLLEQTFYKPLSCSAMTSCHLCSKQGMMLSLLVLERIGKKTIAAL